MILKKLLNGEQSSLRGLNGLKLFCQFFFHKYVFLGD